MATEIIQAGADVIEQDVPTITSPAQGEAAVPFQINPYVGIAAQPFTAEQSEVLMRQLEEDQVEVRPDGLVYLPEIRYRRILNRAFGPGAWALMPRSIDIGDNMLYYRGALFIHGRFVSEAIGEQQYFPNNDRMSYATAAEAAKSNCLVRCCKDLGIASELWDPSYTREWLAKYAVEAWCMNRQDPHKRKKFWRKKSSPAIDMWPWQEMDDRSRNDDRSAAGATSQAPSAEPAARSRAASQGSPARAAAAAEPKAERAPAPVVTPVAPPAAPSGGSAYEKRLISPKQAGRFRAISRVHNWKDRELQRLLAQFRFASVEEITREAYEELCGVLVDEGELAKYRRQIDQEDSAEDVLQSLLR